MTLNDEVCRDCGIDNTSDFDPKVEMRFVGQAQVQTRCQLCWEKWNDMRELNRLIAQLHRNPDLKERLREVLEAKP